MSMLAEYNAGPAPYTSDLWDAGRPRRLGILINPQSGTTQHSLQPLLQILDRYKSAIHRLVVGPKDVSDALAEMAAQQVEVVAVCGGDGTVHAALTALFHASPFTVRPPVVLIAGGTTNMTAADVGMEGKPIRALERLLAWSDGRGPAGRRIRRAILRVDCGPDSTPRFGMFFSAAGIVHVTRVRRATRRQARSGLMRGGLGTAVTVGRYLVGLALGRRVVEPTPIAVRLDGELHGTHNYLALLITTLARLNPGIRPYWGKEDGPLRYTAVSYQPQDLLRAAPSLISGRPSRYLTPEAGYTSRNIHEAVLQVETACALDGQILTSEPSHVLTVSYGGEVDFVRL
ncbi:MAG: acylglycerol kinase family protein [bacterium]|uniref:Acylglycerol kinase family protein n=1 Tax=Candidatus Methylomirabilis tolerans TaxID=3123416 RepID=A0AAJ1EI07_9BACT|nr:acylglycerol kinase family protein [Candidatus Methylomirabilis sp.]